MPPLPMTNSVSPEAIRRPPDADDLSSVPLTPSLEGGQRHTAPQLPFLCGSRTRFLPQVFTHARIELGTPQDEPCRTSMHLADPEGYRQSLRLIVARSAPLGHARTSCAGSLTTSSRISLKVDLSVSVRPKLTRVLPS